MEGNELIPALGTKVPSYKVFAGWSKETEISVQSLVGQKATQVLEGMQKAVLYIGDAQYCKNLPSSNMMLLISRLID